MRFSCDVRGGRDVSRPYKNLLKSAISRQAKVSKLPLVFWLNEIVPNHCADETKPVGLIGLVKIYLLVGGMDLTHFVHSNVF